MSKSSGRVPSGFAFFVVAILLAYSSSAVAQDASSVKKEGFFPKSGLSQSVYGVRVTQNVMIPMRDGTRLAADIYLPIGERPFPVLLQRTPYNKSGGRRDGEYFAARGYAVVFQDTRGRYASEGDFRFLLDDGWGQHQDGYDTVEWIASQSWCNGNVGTFGLSYSAMNQYAMAPTRPPLPESHVCRHGLLRLLQAFEVSQRCTERNGNQLDGLSERGDETIEHVGRLDGLVEVADRLSSVLLSQFSGTGLIELDG